jgi:hypothetical protein
MLWYKGWLETRYRLCMTLGITAFFLYTLHSFPPQAKNQIFAVLQNTSAILLGMICTMLAGAGIVTQPAFQRTKGLHGSMLFTLTLPVSRLRLLVVRAGLGWVETAATIGAFCCGIWFASPFLRATATSAQVLEYGLTTLVCMSAIYFLSVLLATFLDDTWRTWITLMAFIFFWWFSHRVSLPAYVDIFSAVGKASPLIAHTIPWSTMAFSAVVSLALFFAAWKVAQAREY